MQPLKYLYGATTQFPMLDYHTWIQVQSHTISHTVYKMLQVRAPLLLVLLELIISHMMHQTLQAILQYNTHRPRPRDPTAFTIK